MKWGALNAKTSSGALACESLELRGFTWVYEGAQGWRWGNERGYLRQGNREAAAVGQAGQARPGLSTGGGDRGEEALVLS